jgi:hypothetical protein
MIEKIILEHGVLPRKAELKVTNVSGRWSG